MRRELPELVAVDHQWFLTNLGHATMGNGYCRNTVASKVACEAQPSSWLTIFQVSVHMLRHYATLCRIFVQILFIR